MSKYIPLSLQEHKNTKFKKLPNLKHAQEMHLAPVSVQEFSALCHDYPIVFVKDTDTGQFRTVVLLGIKPKQNLYFREDGWNADYVPESLRTYPFALSIDPDNPDQGMLVIDSECDAFNDSEGEALFNEDGSKSEFTNSLGEFISNYNAKLHVTEQFAKELTDRDLLVSKNLELQLPNGQKHNLTGIYLVDEEKLQAIPDDEFLTLRKNGLIVAIHAHLLSLSRINKLLAMSAKQ